MENEEDQEEEESKRILPLNELEVFVSIASKKMKAESLSKAIELFVDQYRQSKDEKFLQNVSRLLNNILPEANKKKQVLLTKQSLVLSKVNFEHLDLK